MAAFSATWKTSTTFVCHVLIARLFVEAAAVGNRCVLQTTGIVRVTGTSQTKSSCTSVTPYSIPCSWAPVVCWNRTASGQDASTHSATTRQTMSSLQRTPMHGLPHPVSVLQQVGNRPHTTCDEPAQTECCTRKMPCVLLCCARWECRYDYSHAQRASADDAVKRTRCTQTRTRAPSQLT